ncbi:hypothetical protein NA56DRAFT_365020 [Hyaloscypha hepaticicola]|uniref:Uncharacterized protein n=1 Tax=Hyaloscypha hepaticicola TaxID=2082293 RepID=A0A2J6PLF7_9HELO|nr:hypothetical protein NA56DRAFT_365020 [Hyaloscypha hepaticicola]
MDHPQQSNVDEEQPIQRSTQPLTTASEADRLATLCEYCVSIRLTPPKSKHARTIYSRNLGEMNQAVKGENSCAMCSFLMFQLGFLEESVKRNKDSVFSMRTLGYHAKRRYVALATDLEISELRRVYCELSYDKTTTAAVKYDICRLATDPTVGNFGVFAGKYPEPHPSNSCSKIFLPSRARYRPRIVNSNPLSEATIGLIKDWLSTCRNHSSCKEQKPRPLPTRVLDVRSENPKIVDGEGLDGLYVTLSHC